MKIEERGRKKGGKEHSTNFTAGCVVILRIKFKCRWRSRYLGTFCNFLSFLELEHFLRCAFQSTDRAEEDPLFIR